MAGHKAANAAPTWPTINGQWIPDGVLSSATAMVENKITVHFIHRGLAYLLLVLTLVWTITAGKTKPGSIAFTKTKWCLPVL